MHHVNNISVLVSTVRSLITNLADPNRKEAPAIGERCPS
jgi:hypothetical protein